MRPSAAEALKAAIRRSLPIVGALVLIGIVAVNAVKQIQGARYSATARVYHTSFDLSAALAQIDPGFVDPERTIETARSLAASPEPYDRAGRRVGEDGGELQASTEVTADGDSDIIGFTTTTDDADRSVRAVNAIADAYVDWRADIQGRNVTRAISQLEAELGPRRATELSSRTISTA